MVTGQHEDIPDVAESFVTTFYHDPDDEINTDGEDGDIFDLYGNSRPLTPLERKDPEGTTTDSAQCSDDPSDQISVINKETITLDSNRSLIADTINPKPSGEISDTEDENAATTSPGDVTPENEATSKTSAEENALVEDV